MNSLIPSFLNIGDCVGVWAPARYVTPALIQKGIDLIKDFGLTPVVYDSVFLRYNQFAGKEQDRVDVFNRLIKDDTIRAIVCAKGGYGSMRLLRQLDTDALLACPRWISGFSDVTAVHAWLNQSLKIPSIHGIMLSGMEDSGERHYASCTLLNALCGRLVSYQISADSVLTVSGKEEPLLAPLNIDAPSAYRAGRVSARLIGGNLSLLYALASTPYDLPQGERFILFIEDLDEYLYHIDRMMQQLKLSGKLDCVAGVIVGSMTEMKDNDIPFGKDAYQIVKDYMDELDVPYYMGFPAGHQELNLALYFGIEACMSVGEDGAFELKYLNL